MGEGRTGVRLWWLWVLAAGCGDNASGVTIERLRPPDMQPGSYFGSSVAISADASLLAVGAIGEDALAGTVRVFRHSGDDYVEEARLVASNADPGDQFGALVAISADGRTLAVGATGEASAARGIDGDQTDNAAALSGAVYVFVRGDGGTWTQQAYVKAPNNHDWIRFAFPALSADGNTLAVAAIFDDSGAGGIDSDAEDHSASRCGAVHVFTRAGASWTPQAYIKPEVSRPDQVFGAGLAIAADGNTLAVGAYGDDYSRGAAYVFTRAGATWSQQAVLTALDAEDGDEFGAELALSADGNTLAVGAPYEDSAATGIDGNARDLSADASGAAYVFARASGAWRQQAYVKASNTNAGDYFGSSLALSTDGALLTIGAYGEASLSIGAFADPTDNSQRLTGAAYQFVHAEGAWRQIEYVKASEPAHEFTWSMASGDSVTAIGAFDRDDVGAVYVLSH